VIILAVALANVTDVSLYVYQRMQVENATQAAGQAAWKTCRICRRPRIAQGYNCHAECPAEHVLGVSRFHDLGVAVIRRSRSLA
jgi:hypothetical protein